MGFREKTREKVLALIQNDPNITIVRMAEELSLTPRGIEYQIVQLKRTVKKDTR